MKERWIIGIGCLALCVLAAGCGDSKKNGGNEVGSPCGEDYLGKCSGHNEYGATYLSCVNGTVAETICSTELFPGGCTQFEGKEPMCYIPAFYEECASKDDIRTVCEGASLAVYRCRKNVNGKWYRSSQSGDDFLRCLTECTSATMCVTYENIDNPEEIVNCPEGLHPNSEHTKCVECEHDSECLPKYPHFVGLVCEQTAYSGYCNYEKDSEYYPLCEAGYHYYYNCASGQDNDQCRDTCEQDDMQNCGRHLNACLEKNAVIESECLPPSGEEKRAYCKPSKCEEGYHVEYYFGEWTCYADVPAKCGEDIVDCTKLEGIYSEWYVKCENAECVVERCADGYHIADDSHSCISD